jgi:hypothetical protein
LPPVAELVAFPELPEFAVDALEPLSQESAEPELPVSALLQASPPLESFHWLCSTWASDEESLSELVSEEADESPDVAPWEPLPEPLELFDALLLPLVDPPEAFALLLFEELPEPETV